MRKLSVEDEQLEYAKFYQAYFKFPELISAYFLGAYLAENKGIAKRTIVT